MTDPQRYQLSQLQALEAESIHIIREVVAEFERPVLLFSGGKDSIVMLRLAEKAFYPARIPFPVMHVDTGHNFPEVLDFRDRRVAELGVQLVVASVPEAIDNGLGASSRRTAPATGSRPRCCWTRWRSTGSPRSSAAPGGTRTRPGPRSGCSPSATSSASGTRRTSARSCGASTTAGSTPARASGSSRCPTGPSSTSGSTSQREGIALPSIYFAHEREVFDRARHALRRPPSLPPRDGEDVTVRRVRYRTVGDASLTAAVAVRRGHRGQGHRRGRRDPDHRARCHPGRRQVQRGRHGGPQAGGLLLTWTSCRFATAGSVDDGKSTLIGRLLYDTKSIFADQLEAVERASAAAATTTSTSRCSPTACGPSASRASRSTSPTATSPRRGASSSSPTPRGTSSTPATWSPAPRPPTWRSCWSTPARACVEQSRRHAFLATLLRVPHLVLCVNKMDLVDYSQAVFEPDPRRVHRVRDEARRARPDRDPDLRAQGRQRGHPLGEHALVRRPVPAAPPGERARRQRPQPDRRPVPGAVRDPAAVRRLAPTTAATPARSPAACSSPATR